MAEGRIKICTAADQGGKALQSSLDFPVGKSLNSVYRVPLTDEVLMGRLPDEALAGICKDEGGKGYYLSATHIATLKKKLDPKNETIYIPDAADAAYTRTIQEYADNIPFELEDQSKDKYLFTGKRLGAEEIAIIRAAITDKLVPQDSMIRLVSNPLSGDDAGFRLAISRTVDIEGYNKIIMALTNFLDAEINPATLVRVQILIDEFEGMKMERLRQRSSDKPFVVPDSFYEPFETAADAKREIEILMKDPPKSIEDVKGDYHIFRVSLFPYEIAFLRYILNDKDNKLFASYNFGSSWDENKAATYYLRTDFSVWNKSFVELKQITDILTALLNFCKENRMEDAVVNRVEALLRETDRVKATAEMESFWHGLLVSHTSVAAAFVGLGAVGAVATTAVLSASCLTKKLLIRKAAKAATATVKVGNAVSATSGAGTAAILTRRAASSGLGAVMSILELIPAADIERWLDSVQSGGENNPSLL